MTFSLFLAGLLGAATIVGVAAWTLSGRRAQSPARQLSTTGEVDSRRSMTKKERLDAGALRAAEWARKRKERKTS